MAAPILGNVLRTLESIYRFSSGQKGAPESFELDLPIIPVHDLAGISQLGSGLGLFKGWNLASAAHTHVGIGIITSTPSLLNPTTAQNGFPARWDPAIYMPWIYNMWCGQNDATDSSSVRVFLVQGTDTIGVVSSGVGVNVRQMLYASTTFVADQCSPQAGERTLNYPVPMMTRPGRTILNEALLNFITSAIVGGTVTFTLNYQFWLGLLGVPPPQGQ